MHPKFLLVALQKRNLSLLIFELPKSFSNLSLLGEFDAHALEISGKIPDDFEKLLSLEILKLGHNHFCKLPSSLMGLSILKQLILPDCKELKSLAPLPSSLVEVNVANCIALESVSDLSNLESLRDLNLTNCEKVVDIPGLENLKSLKRLYMSNCSACSSSVKRRLSKVLSLSLSLSILYSTFKKLKRKRFELLIPFGRFL